MLTRNPQGTVRVIFGLFQLFRAMKHMGVGRGTPGVGRMEGGLLPIAREGDDEEEQPALGIFPPKTCHAQGPRWIPLPWVPRRLGMLFLLTGACQEVKKPRWHELVEARGMPAA